MDLRPQFPPASASTVPVIQRLLKPIVDVRENESFGVLLMLTYWMAHMDWPFIEDKTNFIVDFHLVYAGVLIWLIIKRAGHVWGMDALIERMTFFERHPRLRAAVA